MGASYSTPIEVVDHICSFVEAPQDLLSIALVAKHARDVVIPHHIEFRIIRCDLRRKALWQKLAAIPEKAARFVTIEIVAEAFDEEYDHRELPILVPRIAYGSDIDKRAEIAESIPVLVAALCVMSGLKAFHWGLTDVRPPNELFSALKESSPNMERLEVLNYDDSFNTSISTVDLGHSPLWGFSNLVQFSFTEHHIDTEIQVYMKYTSRMADMLIRRCPNLQDLQIYQNHAYHSVLPEEIVQHIFINGRWPALKRATIEGNPLDPVVLEAFYARHPGLERVCVLDSDLPASIFINLPNLQSLSLSWMLDIEDIPLGTFARLNTLRMNIPDVVEDACEEVGCILKWIPSLRNLILSPAASIPTLLEAISQNAPSLEKLAVEWDPNSDHFEGHAWPPEKFRKFWADFLSCLPNLSHFAFLDSSIWGDEGNGVEEEDNDDCGDDDDDDGEEEEEETWPECTRKCLRELGSLSQSLSHVGLMGGPSIKHRDWIAIKRAPDGAYAGFKPVPTTYHTREIAWGDWYLGAIDGHIDREQW